MKNKRSKPGSMSDERELLPGTGITNAEIDDVCRSLRYQWETREIDLHESGQICRKAWILILELRRKILVPNDKTKVVIP